MPESQPLSTQVLVPSTNTPVPSLTFMVSPQPDLPGASVATSIAPDGRSSTRAQSVVGVVLTDLADRLQVGPAEITVETVDAMMWTGLSCTAEDGEPGGIPGFQIVLTHGTRVFVYRANETGEYVACGGEGSAHNGEPVILDTALSAVVDLAQRNLAARLDLPVSRVFLVEASPVIWNDAGLGCGTSESAALSTPVAGYRIVLRVGSKEYYYHANYRQVVFCEEELAVTEAPPVVTEESTAVPQ